MNSSQQSEGDRNERNEATHCRPFDTDAHEIKAFAFASPIVRG
jgi:hypothetical protein